MATYVPASNLHPSDRRMQGPKRITRAKRTLSQRRAAMQVNRNMQAFGGRTTANIARQRAANKSLRATRSRNAKSQARDARGRFK